MSEQPVAPLDSKLQTLLQGLRRRVRRYVTLETLLALAVLVCAVFWIGFLLDWGPVRLGGTEMPRSARMVLLAILVAVGLVLTYRLFLRRITRSLPDESLALLLERHHPQLGGRLVTAVQLKREKQEGDCFADGLLEEVHAQAAEAADSIDLRRVFRAKPIWSKAAFLLPMLAALALLGALRPQVLAQGVQRLLLVTDEPWPRLADLRMVGLEVPEVSALDSGEANSVKMLAFNDKRVRVARGGAATLRISARADGAEVPDVCTVYYRTAGGVNGQVNMRRVGRVRNGFQDFSLDGPPLAGITEDLVISVRGLDDRLDDFVIEAVDAPGITDLAVEAIYPNYLREQDGPEVDRTSRYQPGLRIREGTTVRLVGSASQAIADVEVAVTRGDGDPELTPVELDPNGKHFTVALPDLRVPTTVVMVPVDANAISAPSPYRYFLGVVSDSPPEVELRLRGIGSAVTADVRIPAYGTAVDDYGVESLRIELATAGEDLKVLHGATATPDREGEFEAEIDVRNLTNEGTLPRPQPGDVWNVYAEALDAYDLSEPHLARTDLLRLEVVKPEDLLAVLERRELALRARLEQTISELEGLRDSLDTLRRDGWSELSNTESDAVSTNTPNKTSLFAGVTERGETRHEFLISVQDSDSDASSREPDEVRAVQLLRLRVQQASLQASKSSDELQGIAAAINDILLEMVNNRVDTPDRSQRMAIGVRDPLLTIIDGSLSALRTEIETILDVVENPMAGPDSAAEAVDACEQVLLELSAVLEKMLDLESYNEVLDLVRGLIEQQEGLIESTKKEQAKSFEDLFK